MLSSNTFIGTAYTDEFNDYLCEKFAHRDLNLISLINSREKTIKILSPCCGMAYEALALEKYFNEKYKKKVNYIGLDSDPDMIQQNKEQFKNHPNFKFYCVDTTHPQNFKGCEPNSIDLVHFGHPDPFNRPEIFFKMFYHFIPYFLKQRGTLLVSSYHEIEARSLVTGIFQEIFKKIYHAVPSMIGPKRENTEMCPFYCTTAGTVNINKNEHQRLLNSNHLDQLIKQFNDILKLKKLEKSDPITITTLQEQIRFAQMANQNDTQNPNRLFSRTEEVEAVENIFADDNENTTSPTPSNCN